MNLAVWLARSGRSHGELPAVAGLGLRKKPVALFVDDLFALDDGEVVGLVLARVGLGADEGMLLVLPIAWLDDDPGGQPLGALLARHGPDQEALVFDRVFDAGLIIGVVVSGRDQAAKEI